MSTTRARLLGFAYGSFSIQYFLLRCAAISGNGAEPAPSCSATHCCACSHTLELGIWRLAPMAYGVGNGDLANINAKLAFFLDQFHGPRPTRVRAEDRPCRGYYLPSVHAGGGLCAWAAWAASALPALVLNILMATRRSAMRTTLVDVIAGLGIAALTISIATSLFYRPSAAGSFVSAGAERFRLALARQRRAMTPAGSPAAVSD